MSYNAIMKTKVISKECINEFDKYLATQDRFTTWEINPTNIPFSRYSMRNNQDRNTANHSSCYSSMANTATSVFKHSSSSHS